MYSLEAVEAAISEVQHGNVESFSYVVECHHIQLRTFISAMVHDRFDADDLAQQTFLFAYQHIQEYELGTNFLAWLKAIAYNHVRDYRAYAQRTQNVKRTLKDEISRKAIQAMEPTMLDPRLELLENCVQRLPENQRQFLRAVCGRRATLDEVATEMNRSSTAVRKNLSRLYENLRVCVEQRLQQNSEVHL
jgi:RNA polymerase sigma-70 factor (ECF subfamily)